MTAPRHVYVHVPFCARRCSYCDFSIAVRRVVPVDEYLAALEAELHTRFGDEPVGEVDTIYFGGGTPSRLGGAGLARALGIVERRFPRVAGVESASDVAPQHRPAAAAGSSATVSPEAVAVRPAEITAEANPEDLSPSNADAWRAAGIGRLSLGSQSFDDRALAWMHRSHDATAIGDAVRVARTAGIDNLSLDLIFALPAELQRNFEDDVRRLLDLAPDHVSLYGLTVEPGTPLGRWVARGTAVEQPEEGYERDFLAAHRMLCDAGFEHYEVSNYSRPGRRSRHNSSYWSGADYLGIGPAAHGFAGGTRRWNVRGYAAWRDAALAGADPVEGAEVLTATNRAAESVYLGLRTLDGLALVDGEERIVNRWIEAGWARLGPDRRLRCTPEGWLRLDALAAALTHHRSR